MTSPAVGIGGRFPMQPEFRTSKRWVDQHGRQWWSHVEKATGHPTGGVFPSGWVAPLTPTWARKRCQPDAKYVQPNIHGEHDGLLHIDYDTWMRDWDASALERDRLFQELIQDSDTPAATLEQWEKDPPKFLLDAIGKGPAQKIPREMIEAMAAGNPWALGLRTKIPSWAEPILARWDKLQVRSTRTLQLDPAAYPDEPDDDEEEIAAQAAKYFDVEEEEDADALGGKVLRVPSKSKPGKPKVKPKGKLPMTVSGSYPDQ